jgi:hypothetical protein
VTRLIRKSSPRVQKNSLRSYSRAMIGRRRRGGAMLVLLAIADPRIVGLATMIFESVVRAMASVVLVIVGRAMVTEVRAIVVVRIEDREMMTAAHVIADRATAIVVLATGAVLRIAGLVRVGRKTVARRLDVDLVADLAARVVLVGRCRGLHRRVDRWPVRHIASKVLGRWMNGLRGWNTNLTRC